MDERALLLAFTAGMIATINPCGFAMLPAYLSLFLGLDDDAPHPRAAVWRALVVASTVSAGFLTVFFALGVPLAAASQWLQPRLPWLTSITGGGLAVFGIVALAGKPLTVRLPKPKRAPNGRALPAMFGYGVAYALSSLSCTIPIFLALVASNFTTTSTIAGLAAFLTYGTGMALVLIALTITIAIARRGLIHQIRRTLPHLHRVSGAFLVVAGTYLTYYGWYQQQIYNGNLGPGGPGGLVASWNDTLRSWIIATDPRRIALLLAAAIVLALLVATAWSTPTTNPKPGRTPKQPPQTSPGRRPDDSEPTAPLQEIP